jgi:hypothetical protein
MGINEARAEHLSRDQEDATNDRSDLRRNDALRWSQMPDAADLRSEGAERPENKERGYS